MYIAILGRQPNLSMAEIESRFGAEKTRWFSSSTATVDAADFLIDQLGGTLKAGKVIKNLPGGNWQKVSQEVINHYSHEWNGYDGKITLGISAYGFSISSREVQKIGLVIKKNLKKRNTSLRLIPNAEPALNTATSHHNKLGLSPNKVELLIVRSESGATIIAESTGAQNITALARRDQARPKRDAFVGMLPPKLALLMVNLASGATKPFAPHTLPRLLDPFCGTGVILQEAALRGYDVYGTDLSDKMIDYSDKNLQWLKQTHHLDFGLTTHQGDAMNYKWEQPINLVVSETYLGQPFNKLPDYDKLEQVRRNCSYILSNFLANIAPQLTSGTPLCLATPIWFDEANNSYTGGPPIHTPRYRPGNYQLSNFSDIVADAGFRLVSFKNVDSKDLIYRRPGQVVGRELLVLVKA